MVEFKKRAQATAFIIVGIVILIGVGFLIYMLSTAEKEEIKTTTKASEQFLSEIKPVEEYFRDCIAESTQDGILLLGQQGGRIVVPPELKRDDTTLWYYKQINVQPSLDLSEKELEQYVHDNVVLCLDNHPFQVQGFVIDANDPTVDINFNLLDNSVRVDWDINVSKEGEVVNFESFLVKNNIPYRRAFEKATLLNTQQFDRHFKKNDPLALMDDARHEVQLIGDDFSKFSIFQEASVGNDYHLEFGSFYGFSDLPRRVYMQDNCDTVPTMLPQSVDSTDRRAQLLLSPGTTINFEGDCPENIMISQRIVDNVTREVPVSVTTSIKNGEADTDTTYANKTWFLDYPVYDFEPTGLRFNIPQSLIFSRDEGNPPPEAGTGILYGKLIDGEIIWAPIANRYYEDRNIIMTMIPGFSSFTPVECTLDMQRTPADVTTKIRGGNWKCIAKLVIFVLALALAVWGGWALIGVLASGGGAAGSLTAAVVSSFSVFGAATATATGFFIVTSALLVGGLAASAAVVIDDPFGAYKSTDSTIVVTPTCDQYFQVHKSDRGAKGDQCIVSGNVREYGGGSYGIKAGEAVALQAKLKKCSSVRTFFCGGCKVKCESSYY